MGQGYGENSQLYLESLGFLLSDLIQFLKKWKSEKEKYDVYIKIRL